VPVIFTNQLPFLCPIYTFIALKDKETKTIICNLKLNKLQLSIAKEQNIHKTVDTGFKTGRIHENPEIAHLGVGDDEDPERFAGPRRTEHSPEKCKDRVDDRQQAASDHGVKHHGEVTQQLRVRQENVACCFDEA